MPQQPQTPQQSVAVDDLIRQTALAAGVPPELALAVAEQESRFNPTAVNPQPVAGGQHATGTFQILPSTAAMLGIKDINNPVENIQGGVRYLRQLMDRHQGDLSAVLAEYGGVKNDTTYVPQVLARMPKFATDTTAPPATPAGPPPPPPGSFAAEHPFLNSMVQGLDPHEQGGRRNIAGGLGGTIGGALGTLTSEVTGPYGPYYGALAGSALFGGAEDLLVEQTGLGKYIGEHLPGGTVDEPVEELDPDTSLGARLWHAAKAGGEQGLYEGVGQLVAAPIRYGARAALETGIGRRAAEAIGATKQAAVTALRDTVDTLRGARSATSVAAAQAGRSLDADVAARVDAAREAARQSFEGVRTKTAEEIAQATAAKREGVRDAVRASQTAREATQLGVEADAEGARTAYQNRLRDAAESGVPSETAAGRAVGHVFEGPARAALDEAGQAVTAAAKTGPNRSLAAAQAEARRIAEEELAPHLVEFPEVPASQTFQVKGGTVKKPPMGPKLTALLARIDDAQLQQLVDHPAMKVLSRILNAPETVDFATLHQLESSLRRSVQGSGDKVINSYVTDLTRHLVGILRDTLAGKLEQGAAPHAAFETATKHYADIVKLFTEGHAPLVKDVALHAPEKIVQALRPDDPTPAKMLVRLLTETSEAGGGAAGKKEGLEALQRVQDAWLHRNIQTGPLDGLADRVAALRLHPEFVDALFNATPAGRQMLENTERLGLAFKQAAAQGAERATAARQAARTAVGSATKAGETGIAQARQKAAQALRGARNTGRAQIAAERTAGATRQEAQKQTVEAARLRAGQAIRKAVGDVRSRAASAGTSAKEIHERAFAQSPLNPRVAAAGRSARGKQLEWVVRAALAGAGYHSFGPAGILLGTMLRSGRTVPEKDLLRFVVHSDKLTRFVIKGLFHPAAKQAANTVGGVAVRGTGAVLKQPPPER